MLTRQPFVRRIAIAFTLMVVVVSGFFSLSIIVIVDSIEKRLATKELKHELEVLLQDDTREGKPHPLHPGFHLFTSNQPQSSLSEAISELPKGFSEWTRGDRSYYVYVKKAGGERYVLLEDQTKLEDRERLLFNLVVGCFLVSVIGARLLGLLVARKVMAPLTQLAGQVRQADRLQLALPLAPQYPDDEIGQLATALDSTLGQLNQSLERERLFTSDVSHELRTPLMVIQGACELLNETPLQSRAREQVERIARAGREMQELVQTFLSLARARREEASSGGNATLARVAEEQSLRWGPQIRAKGLSFELVEEGRDSAHYNLSFLRTVLSNLLRNALHYTETGKVRLILEQGGFRVEDTGMGIPESQRERIFQPFVRGEQTRGEGLGLGLSLVKRVCMHQGWQVRVSNLDSGGSCFRVFLT